MENILEIQKKAEAGDAYYQFEMGTNYQYGYGVPVDLQRSLKWYQKAAENGNHEALRALGLIYENGWGVEPDLRKAFMYYAQAIEAGNVKCLEKMASFYQEGILVAKNEKKAKELYEAFFMQLHKEVQKGNADAMWRLGQVYEEGNELLDLPADIQKAAQLYQQSSDLGFMHAKTDLGVLYKLGRGVPMNYKKAVELYKEAAAEGDTAAIYNLAGCYQAGIGVEKNYEQAAIYNQEAANKNLPEAQCELANMYYNGRGVEKNYTMAVHWYKKALYNGYASACYGLGCCYHMGYGVDKDLKEAYRLFELGAKCEDRFSTLALAECLIEGWGANTDFARARQILENICGEREYNEKNSKIAAIEHESSIATFWFNPLNEQMNSHYAKAYYLLGKLYYADKGKDGASATKAIAMLRTAEKLGYKDEEMPPKMLIEKIMSETEEAEVKEATNCFVEVRERNGLKGERYEVVLHHADGDEDVVDFKGRNKFLYIMALMTTRKGKEAGGLTTIHFDLMRESLAQLVQDCKVNVNGYKEWIDEFLYDSQIERDENNKKRICMKRTASKYSNASHGANNVIRQWCRTEDEYEIFGLRSTRGRFAITTIALEPEQIILPEALLNFMENLPTKEELENYKVEKVKFVSY